VDNKVFSKFSYGVEVLTTRVDGKDYGCIINTAGQVASCDPKKITISVIKKNHTCDMVAKAGRFNISILTEDAPYSVFQHFGFQSGRDVDKFADLPWDVRMSNGIRYIPEYTNAVLSCEVIDVKDVATQVLYIANVVEAKVLSNAPSCTYGYYHAHIKPKKNPAPEQKECWVCKVCGYVYEGAELPDDFVCPLCKHGKDEFEHVVPVEKKKEKGYVCAICGHFEPCEGELPEDYVCPICHHGREDFEPAER
jgi:flavin reductase (DIM6/NTAB) family NADH-FMN oxidoreductase RutF